MDSISEEYGTAQAAACFDLPDLEVPRPTLEEVHLSLTGPASKKDQP